MAIHVPEDLDLLLSLQDRVLETPPASPSHSSPNSPGYHSFDDGSPTRRRRPRRQVDMSAFKDAVKDCLDYDPKPVKKDSISNPKNSKKTDTDVEKFSGLRIRNQLLTPTEISDHFSDIRFVRLSVIKNLLKGDSLSGSWATVGVLIEKGIPRTSSNGKAYSIWKVGSLNEDGVSLFLFGEAYQRNMNEKAGTVFAFFNCNVRTGGPKGEFSLSIFSPNQIIKMGTSVDYGTCQGKRKDGVTCPVVINKRRGIYCKYHKTNSSEKYSAARIELHGGNIRTAFKDHLQPEGVYVVNPLADRTNTNKPKQPLKVLSVDALKRALSGAGKVTNNTHSQGIRMLNEVAVKLGSKATEKDSGKSNKQKNGSEKRKLPSMKNDPFSRIGNQQLSPKRMKNDQVPSERVEQRVEKLIELEIYSSDDEL